MRKVAVASLFAEDNMSESSLEAEREQLRLEAIFAFSKAKEMVADINPSGQQSLANDKEYGG
jgi:hypothetical protein